MEQGCDSAYIIAASLSLLGRIGILSILGARTCAIFHHNRIMVAFFSLLGLAVMILAVLHIPYVSCNGTKLKPENRTSVDLLSVLTVVYELLSTALLAFGCIRTLRVAGMFKWDKKSLVFLILQEGLLYTGFVSLFTTAAMILTYVAPLGSFAQRSLNALTLPISGMMTARFLLHVRGWRKGQFTETHLHVAPSEMEFQVAEASYNPKSAKAVEHSERAPRRRPSLGGDIIPLENRGRMGDLEGRSLGEETSSSTVRGDSAHLRS
ncbi:hypothetical protein DFP72DRAFT_339051 [Ephemerocybe angulata]|uniref:Uncharacterized protein n=1 Tax=Ephemerocybe angulata TaxID=980116 RepID=A0A8H6M727_9AGAR|nr:hypothetical protein DFP72DRAFT_339051 [Tulosesus angulatus]